MKALIVLTAVLCLLSCTDRQFKPVIMPGYVYVQVAPQEYHVVTQTQLDQALKQFGCGVCAVKSAGTYYIVSVPK